MFISEVDKCLLLNDGENIYMFQPLFVSFRNCLSCQTTEKTLEQVALRGLSNITRL